MFERARGPDEIVSAKVVWDAAHVDIPKTDAPAKIVGRTDAAQVELIERVGMLTGLDPFAFCGFFMGQIGCQDGAALAGETRAL